MKNKLNFAWLALTFLLSGCQTSGDLHSEKASQDPSEIKTITNPVQSAPSAGNVNEDLARQVEILKGQLDEQTYQREQIKAQYDAHIAKLQSEKQQLAQEIQILKGGGPVETKGGDLLWDTAQSDIKAGKYAKAAASLKEFLENFPKDTRAESALILKGECEYAGEQFKTSLVSFGQYLDKYPKGKEGAMAWLGQAAALIRMKQKKDAKLFLEQCVTLYPKSHEAKLARRLLKTPNYVPPTLFKV